MHGEGFSVELLGFRTSVPFGGYPGIAAWIDHFCFRKESRSGYLESYSPLIVAQFNSTLPHLTYLTRPLAPCRRTESKQNALAPRSRLEVLGFEIGSDRAWFAFVPAGLAGSQNFQPTSTFLDSHLRDIRYRSHASQDLSKIRLNYTTEAKPYVGQCEATGPALRLTPRSSYECCASLRNIHRIQLCPYGRHHHSQRLSGSRSRYVSYLGQKAKMLDERELQIHPIVQDSVQHNARVRTLFHHLLRNSHAHNLNRPSRTSAISLPRCSASPRAHSVSSRIRASHSTSPAPSSPPP